MTVASFRIQFGTALREDLRHRLSQTRWNDAVTSDWQYGMNVEVLKALVQYWRTSYDFDAAEARLNALPQFRTTVDGFGLHYIHLKGQGSNPRPLLLMNGWPSSFVEYRLLAPMLTDPAAFGGSVEDAFDVVIPALPGFGFSDRPTRPHQVEASDLFHSLMTGHLGYSKYIASGTDIGAGVATRLALTFPNAIQGLHVSAIVNPPVTGPLTEAEEAYKSRAEQWAAKEGAYEHVHYTRPQTLAFALADTPVGLASWIVEKFYVWSDHGSSGDLLSTFPPDMLIDNLMVYWATGTIGSSIRSYYDHSHFSPPFQAGDHVDVPTAICMWPKDLEMAPREWAQRFYNVQQYSTPAHGGHFPAWEAPEAYADDLRMFARLVNS